MMHRLSSFAPFIALLAFALSPHLTAEDAVDIGKTCAKEETAQAAASVRNDEVWLVSTRHLCFPDWNHPQTYELDVRRYDSERGWQDASTQEFCAQPKLPTLIYVHGNRVNWQDSSQYGWQVYQALAQCENAPERMRFVIWTWPSDQIRGPLRDIRAKADRANDETYFLGWFLSQQDPSVPIGLLGYSYGARVVTGGLHLLSGASLWGTSLPDSARERVPARVALLAAAVDHDWICPGNSHGEALKQVDHMLVLYNQCDPALQRYHWVDCCSRPSALGYLGVAQEALGPYGSLVDQQNVTATIGRSHSEDNYFRMTHLREEVCRAIFHPLPVPDSAD